MSTDLLRSEWTKLRSLRSTRWSLAAAVALCVGMCVLATSIYTGQWDTLSAGDRHLMATDTIGLVLQPGFQFGQVAVCVLGVLLMTGEHSSGTIAPSLLAVPRRTPLLAAKAAVLAGVALVLGELVAVVDVLVGRAIVSRHVTLDLTAGTTLRGVACYGVLLAAVALMALAIGTLVRHVAGAVTTVLACVFVLPAVTSFLPGRVGEYASTYLPGGSAGQSVLSSDPASLVGPWAGLGVAVAWAALGLAAATVSLNRRDV